MQLLVATNATQGQRANDFCWTNEGEIVQFGFECDGEDIDGACGCRRAMSGLDSLKATTTMKVANVDITEEELANRLRDHLMKDWSMDPEEAAKMGQEGAQELVHIGKAFDVGNIVEKRGEKLVERRVRQ